jgi:hypothetical protein
MDYKDIKKVSEAVWNVSSMVTLIIVLFFYTSITTNKPFTSLFIEKVVINSSVNSISLFDHVVLCTKCILENLVLVYVFWNDFRSL